MKCINRYLATSTLYLIAALSIRPFAFAQTQDENQAPKTPPATPPKPSISAAIECLKKGFISAPIIDAASKAGPNVVISILEQSFEKVKFADTQAPDDPKEEIASALVRLGDKNDLYWDYLQQQARLALNSDMPYPFSLEPDPTGAAQSKLSPEFLEWAKSHDIPPESVSILAILRLPKKILWLAATGDPRGIRLLQQALWSDNPSIQTFAAQGLAQAQDNDSIPQIIEACARSSPMAAAGIVRALAFFDDPEAQAAVDRYLPKDEAAALREEAKTRKRPFDNRY